MATNDDFEKLNNFLINVPNFLDVFIEPAESKTLDLFFNSNKINEKEFELPYGKDFALIYYRNERNIFMNSLELEFLKLSKNEQYRNRVTASLKKRGLTGQSLDFKLKHFKLLWNLFIEKLVTIGESIYNPLIEDLRRFGKLALDYLNSILGSLSGVFSFVDAIDELKQWIESTIDLVVEAEK